VDGNYALEPEIIRAQEEGRLNEFIIKSALDPGVNAVLLEKYSPGAEATLDVQGTGREAGHAMVRTAELEGYQHILCPIPYLYNEEKELETGFAIDVDTDHFHVYSYLHSYRTGRSRRVGKLPHCKVAAITFDGETASAREVSIHNVWSASYFIRNYLNDLLAGIETPVEFFDNTLYQQHLSRIATVREPEWRNDRAIGLRLEKLVRDLEGIDRGTELGRLYYRNWCGWVATFLTGCDDNPRNNGFMDEVNLKPVMPYVRDVINALYEEGMIDKASRIQRELILKPNSEKHSKIYAELYGKYGVDDIARLEIFAEASKDAGDLYVSDVAYLLLIELAKKKRKKDIAERSEHLIRSANLLHEQGDTEGLKLLAEEALEEGFPEAGATAYELLEGEGRPPVEHSVALMRSSRKALKNKNIRDFIAGCLRASGTEMKKISETLDVIFKKG
jgi:hypothetical protein